MNEKLEKWADLLLDTGKRNNLVNYKDTKSTSVDVLKPSFADLFAKVDNGAVLEAYDPLENVSADIKMSAYVVRDRYGDRLKSNRALVYSASGTPLNALNNIGKRARTAVEETGVNIAYMAFGFINWTESDNSRVVMRAPLLLTPVTIEHESSVDPYKIKIADDVVVNPTFEFKLQSEYGITLPEFDDNAVEYLEQVGGILSKLGWTVSDDIKIGIFSFLKINMYTDLKDNETAILKNNVVRALIGEAVSFDNDIQSGNEPNSAAYDEQHNVVDADSSQAEAIAMAKSGKSFVLQGPPGTGKSQTITNIISECLADGKKVLFVSEKLAALNVVYEKLRRAGLEEFCLELHSHKSNKKAIIDELCRTLKKSRSGVSERARRELDTKRRLQEQLDGYSAELHAVRPVINKTLYALFEEYSACRTAPDIDFIVSNIAERGDDYAERALSILSRYAAYIPSVGADYRDNIWYGYNKTDYTYEGVVRLKSDLNALERETDVLIGLRDRLKTVCGIDADSIDKAVATGEFLKVLTESEFFTPELFGADVAAVKKTVERLSDLAKVIDEYRLKIDAVYSEQVYGMDAHDVYRKLTGKYSGVLSRMFGGEYKRIMNELKSLKKDGKRPKYKEAVAAMYSLDIYKQNRAEYDGLAENVIGMLGGGYNDTDTDFNRLIHELRKLDNLIKVGVGTEGFKSMTAEQFAAVKTESVSVSEEYARVYSEYFDRNKHVASSFDKNEYDVMSAPLAELKNKVHNCAANTDKLSGWCEFVRLLGRIADEGLSEYISETIRLAVKPEYIAPAFEKLFCRQWIEYVIRSSSILAEFSRLPHDEAVKLFAEKDRLNFDINKAKIKAVLSAQRPIIDMVAPGSSVAILLREGEKKRKLKGVRQLLSEIGELAQVLKPCFLMSPLSVSTFLGANTEFDVVIFDEASQIFPQDAVGAIYRGKQLIVVGDSKQMPPTNFFNTVVEDIDDDDDADDVTDFESVLDICSTALPQRRLKWHYRSRYEQLIAFSNSNFYDGELVTFPSAKIDRMDVGVDHYRVNGTFDRKSKTNLAEAERVADLVFEHIEKYPNRSLGVVAFGVAQQGLIDRIIAKRRQKDLSKEQFFRSDREEPFFVKNLETVQGDERDTIIFSVAYAPDAAGKLLLNFGPVNRMGGERRLNVAITRAKYNVKLVSSISATDIDISRAKSEGARLLREYLDYAEHGEVALARKLEVNEYDDYDSEFESEVCEYLRSKGFAVDTQVGCSSFKIDLAVKRPDTSDYVLAIECDGASYHSSKSARDRDRLRQEVLERMGWRFYRIWSTDWFRNKAEEQQRLFTATMAAFDNVPVSPISNAANDCAATDIDARFSVKAEVKHFEFPEYIMADERKIAKQNRNNFTATVLSVLEYEAPLNEEWLIKRIAFMFGREKVTPVVTRTYYSYMRGCERFGITRRDGFLYLYDKNAEMLRVPPESRKLPPREIKHISLDELASGIKAVLNQNITAEKQGLYKLIAAQLGFSRVGEAMTERFDHALELLKDEIDIEGDTISVK